MKTRLVVYFPHFNSGGMERLHLNLAPELQTNGYDVTFLVHEDKGALKDQVPPGVRVVSLHAARTLSALLPLVRFLRKEKPDVLLANLGHNNILAIWARALAGVSTKIIVSQHSVLSAEAHSSAHWQYKVLPWLYRVFLQKADVMIAVSRGVARDMANRCNIPKDAIEVIYNPVVMRDHALRQAVPISHPFFSRDGLLILAAGRLEPVKDFLTLLEAFAKLRTHRPASLIILGEGSQAQNLKDKAAALGITLDIDMPGYKTNILPWVSRASVVVSTSLYEGFSNILVEALACGTPVVSTDCPHGPAEILENGRYGKLVPVGDVQALADAILATIQHPLPKDMLQTRGMEFTVERAASAYDALIRRVLSDHSFSDGANAA